MASVVALAIGVACATSHYHDERLRREARAQAQIVKDQFDTQFKPGASYDDVWQAIKVRHTEFRCIDGGDDQRSPFIDVCVKQAPSEFWYCGRDDFGVEFKFNERRLIGTRIAAFGYNCL